MMVVVSVANAFDVEEIDTELGGFLVSRDAPSASSLTVNFTLSGSAVEGTDFSTITHSVTIPAYETQYPVNFPVIHDTMDEADETVVLTIQSSGSYTIGTASDTALIRDNDFHLGSTAIDSTIYSCDPCTCTCATAQAGASSGSGTVSAGIVAGDSAGPTGSVSIWSGGTSSSDVGEPPPYTVNFWSGSPIASLSYESSTAQPIALMQANLDLGPNVKETGQNLDIEFFWNGAGSPTIEKSIPTSGMDTFEDYRAAAAVSATGLGTGYYPWSINVKTYNDVSSSWESHIVSGGTRVVDRTASEFGPGWSANLVDRLKIQSNGALWALGGGEAYWFSKDGSGNYHREAGESGQSGLVYSGGNYILTTKYGEVLTFGSSGLLASREDRYGNTLSYAYTDADSDTVADEIATITDFAGRVTTFGYTSGKVTTITDPYSRVTTLGYTSGKLTSVTEPDPDGGGLLSAPVTNFTYDGNRLLTMTDAESDVTEFSYASVPDGVSFVTGVEYEGSAEEDLTTIFALALASNTVLVKVADLVAVQSNALGDDVLTERDRFGKPTKSTDANGNTTTIDRDSEGRPTTVTSPDPDGVGGESAYVTEYEYDANGNLELITYPDATTEVWEYDLEFNIPTSYTDRLGNVTLYVLDETFGYVVELRHVVGEVDDEINEETDDVVTTYTYTSAPVDAGDPPAGLIASVTNPLGVMTEFMYDEFGRQTFVTYAVGTDAEGTIEYEYGVTSDLPVAMIDELGRRTEYLYDALDRLIEVTLPDPDGLGLLASPVLTYEYDSANRLITQTDPLGRETSFVYDGRGNQTFVIRPDHDGDTELTITEYVYNLANQLIGTIDPLGRETGYDYDDAGQLIETTLPDPDGAGGLASPIVSATYDGLGRPETTTDALLNVTSYVYSNWGQTVTITLPDPDGVGGASSPVLVREYDAAGNLISETDALLNETTYQYDELGRLVLVTAPDPDGVGGQSAAETEYVYDEVGNLTQIIDPLGNRTVYDYDARGRTIAERHATGALPTLTIATTTQGSRVSEVQLVGFSASMSLYSGTFTLTYDGQTTSAIAYNASAATVQTALEALSNIAPGDVSVAKTTDTGASQIWQITFTGDLAGVNAAQTTVNSTNVMGMMSVTETESTTTHGNTTGEVQLGVLTGATGGTFQLVFDGQTTAPIAYNASTATVDTTLEALSNIDSVSVAGSAGGPYSITFTGSLGGQDVPTLWPIGHTLTNSADLGVKTLYEYDAAGQLTSVTDPIGRQTAYRYDDLGRLTTQMRVAGELPSGSVATTAEASLVNEVQRVGFTGSMLMGGTFTLTYSGQTTSGIAYNASAATVQSALEALSNIAPGDVSVVKTVDTSTSQEWQITFTGSLAATNVSQTTIDITSVMGTGLSESETTVTTGSATSEVQVVTLNGSPTGGTFRLIFGGQQTSTIAYNASAGTVDSALEALSTIDTVTVSGSAGGPYTITFTGSHAGVNVALLAVQTDDLTNANLLLTVSRSAYDAASRLVSVNDGFDNVTEYDYDLLDNLVLVTAPDPDGGGGLTSPETAYEFDAAGQLLQSTDPMDRVTTYEYDGLGRRTKVTQPDPDGVGGVSAPFTTFTYDAAGNLLTVTDPVTHVTEYGYDNLYRRILVTDAELGETSFTFDPMGRMLTLTDPVANTTEWVYDNLGRKIEETNELNESRSFKYDAAGNLIERIDRLGRKIVWEYDDLYRNTAEKWYDGVTLVRTLTWEYDDAGQLTDAYDPASDYSYEYDDLGRLELESQSLAGLSPLLEYERTYNDVGSVTSIQAVIGGTADFENSYTYDNLQRVTRFDQAEYDTGNTVAEKRFGFAYGADGAFTSIDRYADLAGSEYVASTHYAYDGIGRLLRLTHNDSTSPAAGWGNNPLAGYQFAYDAASRFTSINSYLDGSTTFTHDDTNQLTAADHTGMSDEGYTYDANGNRTGGSIDNDPNNQLASDGTYNYTYDDEGNRLTKTNISTGAKEEYTWDHRNRLTLITFKNSGGTVLKTVAQTYDVNNRWIRRTVDPDGATGSAALQETFFSHVDGQIVLEFDGTTASDLSHRYAWNPAAVDQLLADENDLNAILWPLNDHLGTTRDLAEYDNGPDTPSVANHRRFDSFGNIISETNGSIDILLNFTGRPLDSSTGLQNNHNRWYVSTNGLWISEDPIGFNGDPSHIARYTRNAPHAFTDPTGLNPHVDMGEDEFDLRLAWMLLKAHARSFGISTILIDDCRAHRTILMGDRYSYNPWSIFGIPWDNSIHVPPELYWKLRGHTGEFGGTITSNELAKFYNELFHAWYDIHKDDPALDWFRELLQQEQASMIDQHGDVIWRLNGNAHSFDMLPIIIEEAMSETVSRIVKSIAGCRLRGISVTIKLADVKMPAGHDERPGDTLYGNGLFTTMPISDTLTIALLWILENGTADPRQGNTNVSVAEALREWYEAR